MSTPATPSWYDVLGVPRDATPDEIRGAWRAGIADLDPTDRRFAVLNQAAEVLLDPASRAGYDARLAEREAVVSTSSTTGEDSTTGERSTRTAAEGTTTGAGRPAVPAWLLLAVAAATLAVAGIAAYVALAVPSDAEVEEATSAAQAAAERAVVPILSYDARHLDESRAAAEPYLTSGYRKKYDQLFDGIIKQNAPGTGTVLKATLLRSGLVRSGDDRVQVFMLVNQSRTNKASSVPQVYRNWVTVTMENVDGDWLVDDMRT